MEETIYVILVNYNGKKFNRKCIQSVLNSTTKRNIMVIVVDNASTDGSLEELREEWEGCEKVQIIELDDNYGFSKGNNEGIKWALAHGADYVLLLNNDTEIKGDTIEKMVDAQIETDAIIVPRIVYADNPDKIWYAGGCFSKVIWKPVQRGLDQKDIGQYVQNEKCSFANGCCMLLSRKIIQQLGLLDEHFFLYYEDVEYSLRARIRKLPIWYCAEAIVYHKVNGSTLGNESPDSAYYITRNWLICNRMYMKKRFLLFGCYFILNRLAWIAIWIFTNKKKNVVATLEGIRDYQKGVSGRYRSQ